MGVIRSLAIACCSVSCRVHSDRIEGQKDRRKERKKKRKKFNPERAPNLNFQNLVELYPESIDTTTPIKLL